MNTEVYILGTLSFAVMGALLYIYGYRRSYKMPQELQKQIAIKLEKKAMSFITKNAQGVTVKSIANEIKDVKVGSQLQGYRFSVKDSLATAQAVLDRLLATNKIKKVIDGKIVKYYPISDEEEK